MQTIREDARYAEVFIDDHKDFLIFRLFVVNGRIVVTPFIIQVFKGGLFFVVSSATLNATCLSGE